MSVFLKLNFNNASKYSLCIAFGVQCSAKSSHTGFHRFLLCGPLVGWDGIGWDDCLYIISVGWVKLSQGETGSLGCCLRLQMSWFCYPNLWPIVLKIEVTFWMICRGTLLSVSQYTYKSAFTLTRVNFKGFKG